MPKRKEKRVRRSLSQIKKLVKDFKASGLSRPDFAQQVGVHPNLVSRWLKRIEELAGPSTKSTKPKLIPVKLAAPKVPRSSSEQKVEISLRGNRSLRFSEDLDINTLQRIIKAIEEC